MLIQGIGLLWGILAVASLGYTPTPVRDAHGQPGTIRLAEGSNAIGAYEGYKPLTAEAVVTASAVVIVLPARGLDSVGGVKGLLTVPGLALTPAGQQRRIVALDDLYLLGLGPRTGQAVRGLASFLHLRQGAGHEHVQQCA